MSYLYVVLYLVFTIFIQDTVAKTAILRYSKIEKHYNV